MPYPFLNHRHHKSDRRAILGGIAGGIAAGIAAGVAGGIAHSIISEKRAEHYESRTTAVPPSSCFGVQHVGPPPIYYEPPLNPSAPPPPPYGYPPCRHYAYTPGCLHCRDWQWTLYPTLPPHGCPPCQHHIFTRGCDSCAGWKWC